jgi:hypothetical protein
VSKKTFYQACSDYCYSNLNLGQNFCCHDVSWMHDKAIATVTSDIHDKLVEKCSSIMEWPAHILRCSITSMHNVTAANYKKWMRNNTTSSIKWGQ